LGDIFAAHPKHQPEVVWGTLGSLRQGFGHGTALRFLIAQREHLLELVEHDQQWLLRMAAIVQTTAQFVPPILGHRELDRDSLITEHKSRDQPLNRLIARAERHDMPTGHPPEPVLTDVVG
jgi:hypothetical protein